MKFFDDMTPAEKLAHCKKMFEKALPHVKEVTHLADVLDIWDYWAPWMFQRLEKLEAVAEAARERAYEGHENVCGMVLKTRGCRCGQKDLEAALSLLGPR